MEPTLRLALVVPNYRWVDNDKSVFWHIMPYNLCMLAAMVEDLCEVEIVDAYVDDMDQDRFMTVLKDMNPDLVGITVMMDQFAPAAHVAAGLVKSINPAVRVIMGGVYATVNPDLAMQNTNVDYTVVGEGEYVLRALVGHFLGKNPMPARGICYREGGSVKDTGRADFIEDLDALPLPAYHLIDFTKYSNNAPRKSVDAPRALPYAWVLTSRGCPIGCAFCQVEKISGRKFRPRSAENLLREIAWLKDTYGIRSIVFADDNLYTDKERAKEIFRGLIDRKLAMPWVSPGTAVFRLDEEMLDLMRASGCEFICIAIESGTDRVLKEIIRKPVDYEYAKKMVKAAKVRGIYVAANFIVGFPTETWEEIRQTIRFAEELDVDYMKLFHAIPLRHTRLWDLCVKEGALKEGFDPSNIRWSTGQVKGKEFNPHDLTILRAYEWDRINFSTPAKRQRTAEMMHVSEEELWQIRRETLTSAQTNILKTAS
ncbi:MAG: radical SAM protein [Pseudomonadota bacterium]